jgi:hypothetical protein
MRSLTSFFSHHISPIKHKMLTYERLLSGLDGLAVSIPLLLPGPEHRHRRSELQREVKTFSRYAEAGLGPNALPSPGSLKHELEEKLDAINARYDRQAGVSPAASVVQFSTKRASRTGAGVGKSGRRSRTASPRRLTDVQAPQGFLNLALDPLPLDKPLFKHYYPPARKNFAPLPPLSLADNHEQSFFKGVEYAMGELKPMGSSQDDGLRRHVAAQLGLQMDGSVRVAVDGC